MTRNKVLTGAAALLACILILFLGMPAILKSSGSFSGRGGNDLSSDVQRLEDGSFVVQLGEFKRGRVPVFNVSNISDDLDFAAISELQKSKYQGQKIANIFGQEPEPKVLVKIVKGKGIKVAGLLTPNNLYFLTSKKNSLNTVSELAASDFKSVLDLTAVPSACYSNLQHGQRLDSCTELAISSPVVLEYFKNENNSVELYIIPTGANRSIQSLYNDQLKITYGIVKEITAPAKKSTAKRLSPKIRAGQVINTKGSFTIKLAAGSRPSPVPTPTSITNIAESTSSNTEKDSSSLARSRLASPKPSVSAINPSPSLSATPSPSSSPSGGCCSMCIKASMEVYPINPKNIFAGLVDFFEVNETEKHFEDEPQLMEKCCQESIKEAMNKSEKTCKRLPDVIAKTECVVNESGLCCRNIPPEVPTIPNGCNKEHLIVGHAGHADFDYSKEICMPLLMKVCEKNNVAIDFIGTKTCNLAKDESELKKIISQMKRKGCRIKAKVNMAGVFVDPKSCSTLMDSPELTFETYKCTTKKTCSSSKFCEPKPNVSENPCITCKDPKSNKDKRLRCVANTKSPLGGIWTSCK